MTMHIAAYRIELTARPYNRRRRTSHPRAKGSRLVGVAVLLTLSSLAVACAQIGGAL